MASEGRIDETHDAVVVGARCAGATVAHRLARAGWDVLVVDDRPPPRNTVSTHFVFPNTVARLAEIGALERLSSRHVLHPVGHWFRVMGHLVEGVFSPVEGFAHAIAPTRPALDRALLDSAADAGARTLLGERVSALIGGRDRDDPVRGVVTRSGRRIGARVVIGADGRASTVASRLGLEEARALRGGFALLFAYWRGLPETSNTVIDAWEDRILTWGRNEDDGHMLAVAVPPDDSRGDATRRRATYLAEVGRFPDLLPAAALERAQMTSEVLVAPETMMRGFFRRPTGPGWALVGDACHFKHPATAQGISDAIEQAIHVGDSLAAGDEALPGYEAWRDDRAREHYEFSFQLGVFPRPEIADPLFGGMARDPEAARAFLDSWTRRRRPLSEVWTPERLEAWTAGAYAG